MIEGLKPYVEYKDSGQGWLGHVPTHWDLKPGHAAYSRRKVPNAGLKEKTVLSLSYGRIKVKPTDKQHGLVPGSYETYQIVNKGNIIIRGTDLQNDHTSLRIGLAPNPGIISSAYLCLETRDTVLPDYGYQILNVFDLTKAIYRYGSGLRQNLDHGEIKRLPIFLPPIQEQAAIVRFLDYANRKIDSFIRAKRKLIALLNEQKQAIIHRAITRGLNPDVPLKPSGILWLGGIPEHWRTLRLSRLSTKIGDGLHGTPQYVDRSPYHFINGNNLVHGFIHIKSSTRCVGEDQFRRYRVPLDDSSLLMSINGTIGSVALYRGESIILGKSAAYINCGMELARLYLFFFLQSQAVVNFLQQEVTGTTIHNLSLASIRNLPIALPPSDEQLRIVFSIEEGIAPMATAISRIEREIALMQEYRFCLTAEIVTGKLDVREAAMKLPEVPFTVEVPDDQFFEESEAEEGHE